MGVHYINCIRVVSGDPQQVEVFLGQASFAVRRRDFRGFLLGDDASSWEKWCDENLSVQGEVINGVLTDGCFYYESDEPTHLLFQRVAARFTDIIFEFSWASNEYEQGCGFYTAKGASIREQKIGPANEGGQFATPSKISKAVDLDYDWPLFSAQLWGDSEWIEVAQGIA